MDSTNSPQVKKAIILSLIFIFSVSVALAAEPIEDNNETAEVGAQVQQQIKARNMEQLRTMIQEKKQEMIRELESLNNENQQKVYQKQNQVREAVHALLASEDLVGGIGWQISEIARQFNNSVQKTITAEEKIKNRNRLTKFFFGGDKETAEEVEEEVDQNQERIKKLKQLRDDNLFVQEVKDIVGQQIQNIEQEQNRLQELAEGEKKKRGVFGWMFGWLRNKSE